MKKPLLIAVVFAFTTGCASDIYSGGNNLAQRTAVATVAGALIGGATASRSDVRSGLRDGAAYGAAAGLLFGAGENYTRAQRHNADRARQSRSRMQSNRQQPQVIEIHNHYYNSAK